MGFPSFLSNLHWVLIVWQVLARSWRSKDDCNTLPACCLHYLFTGEGKHALDGDSEAEGSFPSSLYGTFLWGKLFLWSSAQHRSCPDHPGKVKCSNYLLPWHHELLLYSTPPHCNFVFTCVIISLRSVSLAKLQVPQEQDVWFCLLLCLAQHWHIGWGRFAIHTCWKEGVIGCLQYFW